MLIFTDLEKNGLLLLVLQWSIESNWHDVQTGTLKLCIQIYCFCNESFFY